MITQDLQQRIDAYRGNPQALMQRYQQSQQLIDLLALQKIKSEKEAAAREMQLQMAQAQPEMPTVAQQREQEVMDLTRQEVAQRVGQVAQQQAQQQQQAMQKMMSGIARAPGAQTAMSPQAMAAGGIVAFQEGGYNDEGLSEEERQRLRDLEMDETRRLMRRYPRGEPRSFAERQDRQREEKGSIYSPYFGMTPSEREAARIRERGLPQVLERQRPIPSALEPIGRSIGEAVERAKKAGSIETYLAEAGRERRPQVQGGEGYEAMQPSGLQALLAQVSRDTPKIDQPNVVQAPQAPRPPVEQPARRGNLDQLIAQARQMPGESGLHQALSKQIMEAATRDLSNVALSGRQEAEKAFGYTDEERNAIRRQMEQLERLEEQRFSPEARRQRALEEFLAGAMTSSTNIGSLGAGARAATLSERAMDQQLRQSLEERLKRRQEMTEKERALRQQVFMAGEDRAKEASAAQRQAMASGASLEQIRNQAFNDAEKRATDLIAAGINRESAEYVARLTAESQYAIAQATRDQTLENQRARLEQRITENERRAIEQLRLSPSGQALTDLLKRQSEQGGKLTPPQETTRQQLEGSLRLAEKKIKDEFDLQRKSLESGAFTVVGTRKE